MSLLLDIVDMVRSPRGETNPPVPYTSERSGSSVFSLGGRDKPSASDLRLTVGESTLFSVLDLISSEVASNEWYLERKFKNPAAGRQPIILGPEQHLAAKLWEQPNDFMTGQFLRTMVEWHYDAVGEGWIVVDYDELGLGIPRALWPVRPDRMEPVTDASKYLLGYIYTGPSGEKVPLDINEVLRITRPHPLEPHRGVGAVQSLLTTLGTSLTAQQWIQNFFLNDATPGGMLELGREELMEADEYRQYRARWNDNHKGVSRSHRVGILEMGTFKPYEVNLRNLQFTEMRHLTRDQVLEAYRVHKGMLGIAEDVNRANAETGDFTFAKRTKKPRLDLWKGLANGPYLRAFGETGATVQFCYVNPVPEDVETDNAERASKTTATATLVNAGFDPEQTLAAMGLPPIKFVGKQAPEGGQQ